MYYEDRMIELHDALLPLLRVEALTADEDAANVAHTCTVTIATKEVFPSRVQHTEIRETVKLFNEALRSQRYGEQTSMQYNATDRTLRLHVEDMERLLSDFDILTQTARASAHEKDVHSGSRGWTVGTALK